MYPHFHVPGKIRMLDSVFEMSKTFGAAFRTAECLMIPYSPAYFFVEQEQLASSKIRKIKAISPLIEDIPLCSMN